MFTIVFQMLLRGECYEKSFTHLELWVVYTPLSVNIFVILSTQQHLEYHCKEIFETHCINGEAHIEP
jgi:hypothetical protein